MWEAFGWYTLAALVILATVGIAIYSAFYLEDSPPQAPYVVVEAVTKSALVEGINTNAVKGYKVVPGTLFLNPRQHSVLMELED